MGRFGLQVTECWLKHTWLPRVQCVIETRSGLHTKTCRSYIICYSQPDMSRRNNLLLYNPKVCLLNRQPQVCGSSIMVNLYSKRRRRLSSWSKLDGQCGVAIMLQTPVLVAFYRVLVPRCMIRNTPIGAYNNESIWQILKHSYCTDIPRLLKWRMTSCTHVLPFSILLH